MKASQLLVPFVNTTKSNRYFYSPLMDLWNAVTKALVGGGPPERKSITNVESNTSIKPIIHQTLSPEENELIELSVKYKYGYRTLETAILVLRLARTKDYRLQKNKKIDKFFTLLSKIEQYDFSKHSFSNKTVVSIEGLKGSGKSTIIKNIAKYTKDLEIISAKTISIITDIYEIFQDLPEAVIKAYEHVNNYVIAYHIIHSTNTIFFIENYYHNVCIQNITTRINSLDSIFELPNSVFDWPYDLPLPELVLFLSISTKTRLQRIQSQENEDIVESRDSCSNLVCSKVLGPGTVGLDASLSADEVTYTALEALEYYGVYAISRAYDPTLYVTTTSDAMGSSTLPPTSAEEVDVNSLDSHTLSPMTQHTTTTQKHRQKRRSSLAFRQQSIKLKSGELFDSEDPEDENNNPQYIYEPELSQETITNRRISMGVYEMFSKL